MLKGEYMQHAEIDFKGLGKVVLCLNSGRITMMN